MELQVVHVRVNDAASGQPTPVRIRFVDSQGRYRAPLGRLEEFPTGFGQQVGGNVVADGKKFAYIDGTCEILLPAGKIQVEVHKGFEYTPVHHVFERSPGQISLRLVIERKFNLEAEGWYAGDVQAHFLSPQAAWLEGAAEGLSVVNLLAAEWEDEHGRAYHSNLLDFTGQTEPPKKDGTLVAVNTLNRGGAQGDFLLLNSHRPVFPLRLGQPGFEHYTPLDWCGQCHRKGGLVASTRFPGDPMFHEMPTQCSLDAIVWRPDSPFAKEILPRWYDLLNQGRAANLSLVGGSGKTGNDAALGSVRTYVHIGATDELTYKGWCEAVARGRTYATRGPVLQFTLEENGPGWRVSASGVTPFKRLEIVSGGDVVAEATVNGDGVAAIELPRPIGGGDGDWLAVRCWGDGPQELLSHTTPVGVLPPGGSANRR